MTWVVAIVAISVLAMGVVSAITLPANTPSVKFGGLNSAHDHAAFLIVIEGNTVDFGQNKYQVKSPFIHVENMVGTTMHKHALQVPVGEFLKSVGMAVNNNCFISDDGRQLCESGAKKLRFFVNGLERNPESIMTYVLNDGDRFLLIYGDEKSDQISETLASLNQLPIFRS